MPETKRPLKVFLCHAHSDKGTVRDLYLRLSHDGVDAWLDKEKLLPGQDWEYEIRKAVHESDVVVVCLSKQFNQAGFRQKEVRLALETAMEQPEGEIFIIPARLEECETTESLRKWHWVDLFEDDGYQRLIWALRARADRIGATLQGKRTWLPKITSPRSIQQRPAGIKKPEDQTKNIEAKSEVHLGDRVSGSQPSGSETRDAGKRALSPKSGPKQSSIDQELKVTRKVTPTAVEGEKAEKATQQKGKLKAAERVIEEILKRQANRTTAIRESLVRFSTGGNSKILELIEVLSARRNIVFAGIIIVIVLLSISSLPKLRGMLPLAAVPSNPTATLAASGESSSQAQPMQTGTAIPPSVATSTERPVRTATVTSASAPVLGGADKIAFVANRDIWLMNVDGSERRQLTEDGGIKSDLQWLPGGEIITFISGLTIKYVNITTGAVEALTNFPTASSLNAFRVSHDGKQVMISLNNEIFVVPFDFEKMRDVHKKSDLLALNGCISPEPHTRSAYVVREALWSANDKLVTWLFKGVDHARSPRLQFDQVSVLDISKCIPAEIDQLDTIPAQRFKPVTDEPVEYNDDGTIPDLDWDGNDLFVFNTSRQDGWGELYVYNLNTKKPVHNNINDGVCCYRDARWSPDGLYLFFAFRDHRLGAEAPTLLYYVLYREGAGTKFDPLPLPEGFFTDRTEAPQPALRPAQ